MLRGTNAGKVLVTLATITRAKGLYNPHTLDGDIYVDGILTSTYTKSIAPDLAHAALWPLRMAYTHGMPVAGQDTFAGGAEWLARALPDGKPHY